MHVPETLNVSVIEMRSIHNHNRTYGIITDYAHGKNKIAQLDANWFCTECLSGFSLPPNENHAPLVLLFAICVPMKWNAIWLWNGDNRESSCNATISLDLRAYRWLRSTLYSCFNSHTKYTFCLCFWTRRPLAKRVQCPRTVFAPFRRMARFVLCMNIASCIPYNILYRHSLSDRTTRGELLDKHIAQRFKTIWWRLYPCACLLLLIRVREQHIDTHMKRNIPNEYAALVCAINSRFEHI